MTKSDGNPAITGERIAELRRLHEAATPPPWLDDGGYRARRESDGECLYEGKHFEAHRSDNIELTVALRNALPALLAEIERLQKFKNAFPPVDDGEVARRMVCDRAIAEYEMDKRQENKNARS